jgi:alkaline phosphatase D
MTFGRRSFIVGSVGAGAVGGLLAGCGSDDDGGGGGGPAPDGAELASIPVDEEVFQHGVASGDPLSDRVLLWTRVSVEGDDAVELSWVIARDPALTDIVNTGTGNAEPARDFTLTVDADGLEPGTTYYYAFGRTSDARSVTGRTRTLPKEGVDRLRLVFTSCANYNNGYFNSYRAIANRTDLDIWIHLGDYIYEYADASFDPANSYGDPNLKDRAYVPPNEILSVADYRARYSQYRRDKDLQEIHRQHPIIAIWDDHETANNAWIGGAENHQPDKEGDWTARKKAGIQAFLEWVPVRTQAADPVPKIFRTFEFGGLFDLIMLDTRLYARSEQELGTGSGIPAEWDDPARTLIGDEQEQWFKDQLSASVNRGSIWRLIGNQVIFSPVINPSGDTGLASDFWEGYRAQRNRVIDFIVQNGVQNLVFMTGDIHTSWAIDLAANPFEGGPYNPDTGEGAFAVELVGPSITSIALEGDPTETFAPALIRGANPQVKFSDVTHKGYVLLDVTPERVQAEWYFANTIKVPNDPSESLANAFFCRTGARHLETTDVPSQPLASAPAPAPVAEAKAKSADVRALPAAEPAQPLNAEKPARSAVA